MSSIQHRPFASADQKTGNIYRPFTIDDHTGLIELWNRAGLPCRPNGRDSSKSMAIELGLDTDESRPVSGRLILAIAGDNIVGSVLATSDGRKGWINRLAVAPKFRHRGLATVLIEKAEKYLHSLGIKITTCLIESENQASISLFQKAGYVLHNDIFCLSKRESSDV